MNDFDWEYHHPYGGSELTIPRIQLMNEALIRVARAIDLAMYDIDRANPTQLAQILAHAALTAIRVPTAPMLKAGESNIRAGFDLPSDTWTVMIDAAIADAE